MRFARRNCWWCTILIHNTLSTAHALALGVPQQLAVQHHRAHVASVLAERGEWETRVVGVSFDGTGYGDDGSIWGGEIFVGSVKAGFERVAHLRSASLPGGDAAAQFPVQAAAGFLAQLDGLPDLTCMPFGFPALPKCVGIGSQRCADLCHYLDRPTFRRSGCASWLYPRDHVRRTGRDVARATGTNCAGDRPISVSIQWGRTGLSSATSICDP